MTQLTLGDAVVQKFKQGEFKFYDALPFTLLMPPAFPVVTDYYLESLGGGWAMTKKSLDFERAEIVVESISFE